MGYMWVVHLEMESAHLLEMQEIEEKELHRSWFCWCFDFFFVFWVFMGSDPWNQTGDGKEKGEPAL